MNDLVHQLHSPLGAVLPVIVTHLPPDPIGLAHGLTDPASVEKIKARGSDYPSRVPSVPTQTRRLRDGDGVCWFSPALAIGSAL